MNENQTNFEEKTFQVTMSKNFLETIGKEQVWDQLRAQVYAYFQNVNWYVMDGSVEEKDDKLTFIIKVTGKKGFWKEVRDEARREDKSLWQKTKEKFK